MAENEVRVNIKETLIDGLNTVTDALPKDFNKSRFVQNSIALLNDNSDLKKYGNKLVPGLLKAAYLGLDFMNKECYLIPYGGQLRFQTSYIGEIKFTKKYSKRGIKSIYAKVVRQGDEFTETIVNGLPSIDFKPLPFNDGDIQGAFAVCLYDDNELIYESMSVKEIQEVRSTYSAAKDSPAWKNPSSFGEMCKKTVLRRLCKHIDTDFESVEAKQAWEEGSDVSFKKEKPEDFTADPFEEEAIDVEAVEVEEAIPNLDNLEVPFK
jgi:recombination protein RecT